MLRTGAIVGGVACPAIEISGAVSYLVEKASPSYLIAGGAVTTAFAGALPLLAGQAQREGGPCWPYCCGWHWCQPCRSSSVRRSNGPVVQRMAPNGDRQVVAQRIALAREAVQDAKSEVDSLVEKATDECSRAKNPKADPRGPRCSAAEGRADQSRQRLEAARDKLVKAGVIPKDPMASRLAAVLPVSEEAVQLYYPLILPLSISVMGRS